MYRSKYAASAAAAVALLTAPSLARATSYDASLLNQFNEIVLGNVTSNSETEGRAVIGGNLSQGGSGNYCFQSDDNTGGCATQTPSATTPQITVGSTTQNFGGLTVYGNASGNINTARGNMFIGGTNTAALSLPGRSQTAYVNVQNTSSKVGGSSNLVYQSAGPGVTSGSQNGTTSSGSFTLPSFTTSFATPMLSLSTYLDGLSGVNQGTSNQFHAMPTTIDGVKVTVYHVSGANLAKDIQNFSFSLDGAQTVVIDVDGTITGSLQGLNTFSGQDDVIWNFADNTSLTLPNWAGTILAPDATLTMNGVSQGDVVAGSLIQVSNEIHTYAFTGDLDLVPVPKAVPEPASLALLGVAIGGIVWAKRRRPAITRLRVW
jgi:choice-of-anchor A domain-containing protein